MEVEDEVQLADIAKVAVQDLHIVVDDLQRDQLVVALVNAHHKVQAGIPLVHHLQSLASSETEAWAIAWEQYPLPPSQSFASSVLSCFISLQAAEDKIEEHLDVLVVQEVAELQRSAEGH